VSIQAAPTNKSATVSTARLPKRTRQAVSHTGAEDSDSEDEAAEVTSPEKSLKAGDAGTSARANRKGKARYSAKDRRVYTDLQSAISSDQHVAASVMAESDLSIAKLKVEAQERAVEKLNEGNLAIQREANKVVLAASIRETAAELRKEDPSLSVLDSIRMAKEALSEFL
jgi:hypothetical protein